MKIINLWINIWAKNDQISKKSRKQRCVHISVGNLRKLKVRMLKYSYQCNYNSFACWGNGEMKVILRLWVFEWNFSNQCQCHYFRYISFEVYIWVVTSYHIISYHFLSYFFVFNFNLLGLYVNLKFWEKKFLSAIVTKSNNQNIHFKSILFLIIF